MMGLNSMFLKSLAITSEGKCVRHPHVCVLMENETVLQECECCWKDLQSKKDISHVGELSTTSAASFALPSPLDKDDASSSSGSASGQQLHPQQASHEGSTSNSAALTMNGVHSTKSDSTYPFPLPEAVGKNKAWVASIMTRWSQVQELSGTSTMALLLGGNQNRQIFMEDGNGRSNYESFNGSFSICNPSFLGASMEPVVEEPSVNTHSVTNTTGSSTGKTNIVVSQQQWRSLEEQVKKQAFSIQKLQETVEHQEASIRQDLHQLIQLVTNLSMNQQNRQQQATQRHDFTPQQEAPMSEDGTLTTAEMARMAPVLSNATTEVISNTGKSAQNHVVLESEEQESIVETDEQEEDEADEEQQQPHLERPGFHPANLFSSVRTMERRPPKPPVRHGSFSTQTQGSARQSFSSNMADNTIISSLENSSFNDTTHNTSAGDIHLISTSTSNSQSNSSPPYATPPRSTPDKHHDDLGSEQPSGDKDEDAFGQYDGHQLLSMLEKERSKPLDIIFDASAALSVEMNENEENKKNGNNSQQASESQEEEKKSDSSSGSVSNERRPGSQNHSSHSSRPCLEKKTRGSLRLNVQSEDEDSNLVTTNDMDENMFSHANTSVQSDAETSGDEEEIQIKSEHIRPRLGLCDTGLSQDRMSQSLHDNDDDDVSSKHSLLKGGRFAQSEMPSRADKQLASQLPVRQPQREWSKQSVASQHFKSTLKRSATEPTETTTTTTTGANSTSYNGVYVPPRAAPPARSTDETNAAVLSKPPRSQNSTATRTNNNQTRLTRSGLSKLGRNTAPPRREIFATRIDKNQISSLTIDSALLTSSTDLNGNMNDSPTRYREVVNVAITDKFGDNGIYTGTLREEVMAVDSTAVNNYRRNSVSRQVVAIPHGSGTMKYEFGRFYKGEWRDGHWHGKGILRNANGDSYEGEFVYDARHGRGIYKYENGDVYEGDFSEDRRHGKGTFMFHNGSVYRGDFVNGNFEGYGWYEFADGFYEGEWKAGAYHGIGTLQYIDGGSYTGRFYDGRAHGLGEERDADGTVRRGTWVEGELSETK